MSDYEATAYLSLEKLKVRSHLNQNLTDIYVNNHLILIRDCFIDTTLIRLNYLLL